MNIMDFSFTHKEIMDKDPGEVYCPECGKYSLIWISGICQEYCMCMADKFEFYEKPSRDRIYYQVK